MTQMASPLDDPTFPPYIVGVGASAGGLQALEALFRSIPPDTDLSFVVVQHLSVTHKSVMDQLLERVTRMMINTITEGMQPQSGAIHLMPAGAEVTLEHGLFRLLKRDAAQLPPSPINTFFASLAREMRHRAIGIVLSGAGSDGARGVVEIHEGRRPRARSRPAPGAI